ncbi:MAG: M15 family metallopeptidase [Treponemataceae bacterium]|nr:M15 family metallopeptidase [Treponemataceae bacterium]
MKKSAIRNAFAILLSLQTVFACAKSNDMKKLESLFDDGKYPFSNVLGEAPEMAEYILKNKADFLADLNYVLENDKDDLLLLIDKTHKVSSQYKPADLIPLTDTTHYVFYRNDLSLRIPAEKSLQEMADAARKDGINHFLVSSTFRSYEYQTNLFNRYVKQDGLELAERYSARPGTSQHQLGTAVDFGSITDDFAETKMGEWVYHNAAKFGWSLSFPKGYEPVTGYMWECWHFRYVGAPACRFQEKWFKNCQQYMLEFIDAWRE